MKIRRFEPGDAAAIERLNQRLAARGVTDVVFPEGHEQRPGPIRQRLFVAEDGDEIRGGVWLKEHAFRAGRQDVPCGWLKYPVAESLIDPAFSGVPGSLIFQCLREQPRLMALGLGGHETPLARILARLKWTGVTIPLAALLVRPGRALRELGPMRRSAGRRAAATALSWSGAALVGARALASVRAARAATRPRGYTAEPCDAFGPWADDAWGRDRDAYGFLAGRDAAMLAAALPAEMPRTLRLRIKQDGADVGWSCLVVHDFSAGTPDRNFGRLTVGLIADALAHPKHAAGVVSASVAALIDSGVDLVFTNQLHSAWIRACHDRGFINGPSTFAFYRAPAAQALIAAGGDDGAYITRGDCDGPLWFQTRGAVELP